MKAKKVYEFRTSGEIVKMGKETGKLDKDFYKVYIIKLRNYLTEQNINFEIMPLDDQLQIEIGFKEDIIIDNLEFYDYINNPKFVKGIIFDKDLIIKTKEITDLFKDLSFIDIYGNLVIENTNISRIKYQINISEIVFLKNSPLESFNKTKLKYLFDKEKYKIITGTVVDCYYEEFKNGKCDIKKYLK